MKELRADRRSLERGRAELVTINHTITSHATTAEVQTEIVAQLRIVATLQDLAGSVCLGCTCLTGSCREAAPPQVHVP